MAIPPQYEPGFPTEVWLASADAPDVVVESMVIGQSYLIRQRVRESVTNGIRVYWEWSDDQHLTHRDLAASTPYGSSTPLTGIPYTPTHTGTYTAVKTYVDQRGTEVFGDHFMFTVRAAPASNPPPPTHTVDFSGSTPVWTPGPAPTTLAGLVGYVGTSGVSWPVGKYVTVDGSHHYYWNGSGWVADHRPGSVPGTYTVDYSGSAPVWDPEPAPTTYSRLVQYFGTQAWPVGKFWTLADGTSYYWNGQDWPRDGRPGSVPLPDPENLYRLPIRMIGG